MRASPALWLTISSQRGRSYKILFMKQKQLLSSFGGSRKMDWRDRYKEKIITAQQAAGMIRSGQRVLISLGTVEPQYIANALCDRWRELRDVEILTSNTM